MSKIKRILSKIDVEKFYIFNLMGYLISTILSTYFVLSVDYDFFILRMMKYVFVLLILLKIIVFDLNKYSRKAFLTISLISICVFISMIVSDNRILALTFVAVIGAYNLNFKKILKWFIICEGGLFAIIVLLSVCGIVPDLVFTRDGDMVRHSLGFKWCATPAIFGWSLSTAYFYYRRKIISWAEIILVILINILLFILTGTRLELVCVVVGAIATLLDKYSILVGEKWFMKLVKNLVLFLPLAIVAGSCLLAFAYNSENDFMSSINKFTSSRLRLNQKGIAEYGVHLFGNDAKWVNQTVIDGGEADLADFNVVDNSYVSIFIRYGLVVGMIIISLYYAFSGWAIGRKDILLQMLLIIVFVHSFFNPHLITLPHNAFLLMMPSALILLGGKKNAKE